MTMILYVSDGETVKRSRTQATEVVHNCVVLAEDVHDELIIVKNKFIYIFASTRTRAEYIIYNLKESGIESLL